MEVSLKKRIASREWHVYGKTIWKAVFAEKERDQNALIIDCFFVAWKRKLKTKQTVDIIGHIKKFFRLFHFS